MLGEIDRDFYCHHQDYCKHLERYGIVGCTIDKGKPFTCPRKLRKWPTPGQFKEEYGEEYPDNGAVYVHNSGWGFMVENYLQAKKRLIHVPETEIICACTPWGKPPDDWRPE